ncbi:hypothetical protein B0H67DRAFT_557697 [Lasiosphaeris hirsuta]|uniref:Uncharacterized protein n=1 Tax=Lasiosphaeris hirsuta TaxID=260670 RepID=A0AA39ZWP0_9PEZI|nr:hypothetical protein B0H67DRAFT_557697 [Lasiosphaeris hirsuta]
MSSSAVAELEAGLQIMLGLKPPGVSGSRIANITTLCVANVQSESVLIQKLFTHFKKTPGTHKLGVLYVVDSVTRKWMDQAKAQGQSISLAAPDGTFAAGVHKVTELMPILMNDIITTAPEDQKEKIRKLVDIWEKGQTFPPSMVNSFKEKLSAPRTTNVSTTPPGSPPPNLLASLGGGNQPAAPRPAMPNIMETLANIARQNATTAQSNPSLAALAPAPVFSNGAVQSAPVPAPAQSSMQYLPTSQPAAQPVNLPAIPFAYPPPVQPGPPAHIPAPVAVNGASNQANAFSQGNPTVQLLAALAAQGIPLDKLASVIQLMGHGGGVLPGAQLQQMPQPSQTAYAAPPGAAPAPGPAPWQPSRPDEPRDRNGYHDSMRSPARPRGRSRSRSPRGWDSRDSPRTRGTDRGFEYGRPASPPGHGRGRPDERERDRGRGGRMPEYRQRSPPNNRRAQSTPDLDPSQQERWIQHDPTLASGSIKVYSRTLFVGGVTCSESELRQTFSRFGQVQTCIVNKDKRHAFVKMFFRKDAEAAKAAMEDSRNQDLQLRTRWGVGFGPRDCSDYQSGISIIPIHKLTDADRKWMLTAPYGGSGGRPIVSGMCVEEPDIEIGAGVSSKAISRRMQTDKGGNHGPKSSRREDDPSHSGGSEGRGGDGGGSSRGGDGGRGGGEGRGGRWRHGRDKHRNSGGADNRRDDRGGHGVNDEPIVMNLPEGITLGPNGINYPPNYTFSAANQ